MIKPTVIHSPSLHELEQTAQGQRIGLLGGSFNPPHNGHLKTSLYALKALNLDALWWLVSPQNPLKSTDEMKSLEERVVLATDLCKKTQKIIVTDLEKTLKTSYTIDTIERLKGLFPNTHFVWLMGSDNLESFDKWKDWQGIFKSVPIAVFRRPPYGDNHKTCTAGRTFKAYYKEKEDIKNLALLPPPAWTILDNPEIELSATEIRKAQKQKEK